MVSMYGERERELCGARGQRARVGSWSGHETFGNRTFGVATACAGGAGAEEERVHGPALTHVGHYTICVVEGMVV